jgi:hypothetical protein
VPPRLTPYSRRRQREYLTVKEVGLLMDTARKRGRYGHKNIQHTVRYTELSPERFKSFWED